MLYTTALNFTLEHAIRKFQEDQMGLKLNGTHQLQDYADDMNLLGDNRETTKKITETLTDATKKVGLKENINTTKYMLMSPSLE
jgi:hypothetical protein